MLGASGTDTPRLLPILLHPSERRYEHGDIRHRHHVEVEQHIDAAIYRGQASILASEQPLARQTHKKGLWSPRQPSCITYFRSPIPLQSSLRVAISNFMQNIDHAGCECLRIALVVQYDRQGSRYSAASGDVCMSETCLCLRDCYGSRKQGGVECIQAKAVDLTSYLFPNFRLIAAARVFMTGTASGRVSELARQGGFLSCLVYSDV